MAKIWKQEPAWLEKKRQLAVLLQSRFPTLPTQEEWGDSWQKGTTGMSRGWLSLQEDSLTAMPLEEAVNEYSTLLQENLMEKAIFWQDSQLAAMHLANIDCGQFIYLRPQVIRERPIVYGPHLNSTNSHNIIVVSAGANVVIEERMVNDTLLPSYEGTEILIGVNAHVTYRQANRSTSKNIYRAIHAYQAHGSTLQFEVASQVQTKATVDLYSFLDGQNTQWVPVIALDGTQHLTTMVDGFGKGTSATLTQYRDPETVIGAPFKVKAGEPLTISEDIHPLKELANSNNWLKQIMTAE